MESPKRKGLRHQFPFWTVAVLILSISAFTNPLLRSLLIYDRQAISAGEIWRVFTGHFVHFSLTHLIFNAVVFCSTGFIIEIKEKGLFFRLWFVLAFFTGMAVYLFEKNLLYFGGLSGLAIGALVYLLFHKLSCSNSWEAVFSLVFLILIAVKIIMESISGRYFFVPGTPGVIPVPASHIAGCFAGGLFYMIRSSFSVCKHKKRNNG